jgi:hypothetical protein
MAQYKINDTTLTAIGDAIRNKSGKYTKDAYVSYPIEITINAAKPTDYTKITLDAVFEGIAKVKAIVDFKTDITNPFYEQFTLFSDDKGTKTIGYLDLKNGKHQEAEWTVPAGTNRLTVAAYCWNTLFSIEVQLYCYDINGDLLTTATTQVPNTMTPARMADAIDELPPVPSAEDLVITGGCNYRFANDGWNWFINLYGNQITTKDIISAASMFQNSKDISYIPFDININNQCKYMNSMFAGPSTNTSTLTTLPLIKGELTPPTSNYIGILDLSKMFQYCVRLREIPYDYFWNFGGEEFWEASKKYSGSRNNIFDNCYSLRELPDISMLINTHSAYSSFYASLFNYCHTLNEIIDLPVNNGIAYTSNMFSNTFSYCYRLKNITFAMNEDGTPQTANWKTQTIDLGVGVGSGSRASIANILNYNSGITADKEVKDDATYQALKDDPDWFAIDTNYSRYNHDSAVATINSLPDTSAYLAEKGGTNTIKFKGAAGELTDGGAINTLTEEEIAVATAKGWTVSLA